MARRLLVVLAVALPLAGCGGTAEQAVVAPPAPPPQHYVPLVAKRKLVRRAEHVCHRWLTTHPLHPPAFNESDPLGSLRRTNDFARHVVVSARGVYRRLHALGVPRSPLARHRWRRFMSQLKATIDHLDEVQAGTEVLDITFARDSLRQLRKSSQSATRRGHRLGLRACAD